jgi:hypothetical protein
MGAIDLDELARLQRVVADISMADLHARPGPGGADLVESTAVARA